MEIEKKYLVSELPDNLPQYKYRKIEQGYLSTSPVVRVRMDNDKYYLTYKGKVYSQEKNIIFHSQKNHMNILSKRLMAI